MNQKLFNVLLFTAGAAVGSLVTWKIVKDKYERIAQEEIDSVKETWARRNKVDSEDDTASENADVDEEDYDLRHESPEFNSADYHEYFKLADKYGKSGDTTENNGEGEGNDEVPYVNGPYVITPNEFGDGNYEHDIHGLTYYADGILANDWDETFDVDDTIGMDALAHFGDYEEDVVHVRNERLNADYEVVRDPRKYVDVVAANSPTGAYAD